MANRNIKGITIEIGGDTTDLQKALKEPEENIKSLYANLRAIETALKFQPGNVDLIGQKFEVLSSLVEESTSKLKTLEDAQAEVQRQFESGDIGAEQYRAFQLELEVTRDKTKQLAEQAALIDTEFKRAATAAGQSMQELGGKIESAGKSFSKFSLAAAGAATIGVKTFVDFDDAMRQVKATIGATEEEFEKLKESAIEAGKSTRFSATEAAEGLNYLALAGYDAEKSVAALPSILNLATAGNLDLAYASDLLTDSMSALGLGVEYIDTFIDELVRTSQRANTDVAQLGEAILVAGGQAKLAGLDTNDLNTALGILGDVSLKGSEGGTALRNTLKNLYTPTDSASKALKELGVETSTANGELRNIQDVLIDLDKALSGLTEADRIEAMNKIFDSRTIGAANALLSDSGDRWNELSEEIANAAGATEEFIQETESGLGGALRGLKSAAEEAGRSFGEALAPMIKVVAEALRVVANAFSSIPAPIQGVIAVITLLVAAIGPLLIITGSVIKNVGVLIGSLPQIINFVKAAATQIQSLNVATIAQTAATKLATAAQWLWNAALSANPIGLVIAAIVALIAILVILYKNVDQFREAVDKIFNAIKEGAQKFENSIQTLFTETIPGIISDFLAFFWQTPEEIGRALGEAIAKAANFAKDLPKNIIAGLKKSLDALKQWGKDFIRNGVKSIQDFVDGVIDKIQSLPGEFVQLGRDMIQGFINGIKDMFSKALQAVKDFFKGIVDGVKDTLGIKSPSKVFAGIGEDSADGWMVGWEDEIKKVKSQLGGAVSELINFNGGSPTAQSRQLSQSNPGYSGSSNFVYNDNRRQTISRLAELEELADWKNSQRRLARMGGV